MPGDASEPIVRRALDLAASHHTWPSLQVIDTAIEGCHGSHPDFEAHPSHDFGDWLEPPSPFAELLRQAFGAHLEPSQCTADSPEWHEVIEAFGKRYSLWR